MNLLQLNSKMFLSCWFHIIHNHLWGTEIIKIRESLCPTFNTTSIYQSSQGKWHYVRQDKWHLKRQTLYMETFSTDLS